MESKQNNEKRELFHEYLRLLQRTAGFRDTLLEVKYQNAFDRLVIEAWHSEENAILTTEIPSIMDTLNLLANISNKRIFEMLQKTVEDLEQKLDTIQRQSQKKRICG
ncbi:MAG: hypothetical protein JSV76_06285 [Candidatus Bathyarchaeota archaeon]|nr:MAG: hypothetical protein JSV76_06285 [Candidatus Bathyarchaeota archaeon]